MNLKITGAVAKDRPVLLVANHSSWLDIPVISAVAPVSFIAKKEVGGWPGVSALANLQRTVFVDREKRLSVAETAREIKSRLNAGDTLVLFAEGTSTDGNRVLPFKTSLFAAVKPGRGAGAQVANEQMTTDRQSREQSKNEPVVQTLTLVYTRLHGVPLGRHDRPLIGWFGDMDMIPHAWQLLKAGPVDVEIHLGAPAPLEDFKDRKHLARQTESEIRTTFLGVTRGLNVTPKPSTAA
ncbi:MAG: lysophospholipid acyltransferase family protein [Pseudomonadota bacterium]